MEEQNAIEELVESIGNESIDNRDAVIACAQTLKDENSDVGRKAAKALGKIGDKRSVKALELALKDESKPVQEEARKSLEILNTKSD
jgi:HEAT repeat protein